MKDAKDIKNEIQAALLGFTQSNLADAATYFWKVLGYESKRRYSQVSYDYDEFLAVFSARYTLRDKQALRGNWTQIHILFQLTDTEIKDNLAQNAQQMIPGLEFESIEKDRMQSYLFAAIELDKDTYTRTELATLTREINRCFAMPVLILIKTGSKLTLSVINRRMHKKDASKDVLEKVTLIKDIALQDEAHRAHIEILFDLSIQELNRKHSFVNFDQLHRAWELTLDTSVLSNAFYKELRNWFLWAIRNIRFPQSVPQNDLQDDGQHQKISAIRLLTRFMFCWFLKEKQDLVPRAFFEPDSLKQILKDFDAYSDESTYYQAIMQNLFFATLSIPQDERKFISDKEFHGINSDYGKTQVFRYQDMFKDQDQIPPLFSGIPFLNGGLFDCLDKKPSDTNPSEIRLDGFSNTQSKRAVVPNKLFWSDEIVDLSLELGSNKARETKVIGLIRIFEKYKFTVEENTPIDEEIALDPTLLGKAFEELLAYYNPETKEAAKNQTGSFYTPPYIADFMVTKSMRAFLMNSLLSQTSMSKADAGVGLDILLSYTEKEHAFNELETRVLVKALDQCKAIDPACGSGAFLMGILHKMVFILQKLDKENKLWFELLIENIPDEIQEDMRKKLSIENYTYVRKRGLIQKCIYGVDIQPIAIQIAKLRFFLTLLIEQDIDKNNSVNYGILPLPNLEFKLVCADSLLRFQHEGAQDKDQFTIELANPYALELKGAVNEYFSASHPDAKQKKAQKIRRITDAVAATNISTIKSKLENYTIMGEKEQKKRKAEADHLMFEMQQWQSYHGIFDNRTILFFEPQYQFPDVEDGFDIVIGNPPYIQLQKEMIRKQTVLYEHMNYQVFERTGDIYCLFYERGFDILRGKGILCYITSNKWMRSAYGKNTRRFLKEETNIDEIIDFSGYQVFKSAAVDTNIIISQKTPATSKHNIRYTNVANDYDGGDLGDYHSEHQSKVAQNSLNDTGWTLANPAILALKAKIESCGKPLKDLDVNIYYGIKTGCNEAFIVDTETKERLCMEEPKSSEIFKQLLRGKDIGRYYYKWAGLWLIFIPWHFPLHEDSSIQGASVKAEELFKEQYPVVYNHLLQYKEVLSKRNQAEIGVRYEWYALQRCAASYNDEFQKGKIVYPIISTDTRFSYDDAYKYVNDKAYLITGESLLSILSILNSSLMECYFRTINAKLGKDGMEFRKIFIENTPISYKLETASSQLSTLTERLLSLFKDNITDDSNQNIQKDRILTEINTIVYDLYNLNDDEIALVEKEVSR